MRIFVLITTLLLAWPAAAQIQPQGCRTYEQAVAMLRDLYEEEPIGRGLAGTQRSNTVVEIWVSEKGTWTALQIMPNGCVHPVAGGTGWHIPVTEPGGDGA